MRRKVQIWICADRAVSCQDADVGSTQINESHENNCVR
ncbi:hypothetical protein T4C_10023 [Trichinella pseudospiralis]|uniref:Uncharacterized protein n=1 Tax=Trichinella pseudospiralis TaxID=6337 RepID=A0A0V1G9I7_TRIPS|nr:hypothetical protein T4C_10023 [Trichinella pseudospiralis]